MLKILIARSPKIPHVRRLSNPLPTNGFGGNTLLGSRPRGPRLDTSPSKPRRYGVTNMRATLLQPPYMPGQIVRPVFQGSPTSAFYRINPMPPPLAHNSDQLSPTGGAGRALGSPLAINNVVGGMDNVPSIVVPIPQQQGPPGVMVYQPTAGQLQPSNENLQQQPSTGLLSSSESLNVNSSNIQFPLSSSSSHRISEVTEGASPASSLVPTHLQIQSSKLVSEVSPTAVIVPSGQNLPQAVFQANHQMGMEAHQVSVLGPGHLPSTVSLANQEHALLPSTGAQIPAHYGDNPSGVANAPPVPTRMADTGPLLPNPPQPIIPQYPPPTRMGSSIPGHYSKQQSFSSTQHANLRKETLCKHYVSGQGQCPYGDKCWFAHPDPINSQQSPQRWASKVATSVYSPSMSSQGSPLHTPIPGQNLWMTNQNVVMAGMPQFVMASPPQSPLNTGVVTVPSAHLGALNQPRATYPLMANQQQWPLLLVRPPQQNDIQLHGQGSAFATMTSSTAASSGVSAPQNPVLRFDLLTDLKIRDNNYTVSNITQLASRADHFYVSYNSQVLDYKILFGSNRPSNDRCYLTEKRSLYDNVSCVHCSHQQQALLVIGTEMGNVSMWDLRRGVGHGNVTEVCKSMPIVSFCRYM